MGSILWDHFYGYVFYGYVFMGTFFLWVRFYGYVSCIFLWARFLHGTIDGTLELSLTRL